MGIQNAIDGVKTGDSGHCWVKLGNGNAWTEGGIAGGFHYDGVLKNETDPDVAARKILAGCAKFHLQGDPGQQAGSDPDGSHGWGMAPGTYSKKEVHRIGEDRRTDNTGHREEGENILQLLKDRPELFRN